MTPAEIRVRADAVRRLATDKLAWCAMEVVQKRYKGIPETLESIRVDAEFATEVPAMLEAWAARAEERERAA